MLVKPEESTQNVYVSEPYQSSSNPYLRVTNTPSHYGYYNQTPAPPYNYGYYYHQPEVIDPTYVYGSLESDQYYYVPVEAEDEDDLDDQPMKKKKKIINKKQKKDVPVLGEGRKKRDQVKTACTNCRKACKKCSHSRPCLRCIEHGIADSCVDVPRKSRVKPSNDKTRKSPVFTDREISQVSPEVCAAELYSPPPNYAPDNQVMMFSSQDHLLIDPCIDRPLSSTGIGQDFVLVHESDPQQSSDEVNLISPKSMTLKPHLEWVSGGTSCGDDTDWMIDGRQRVEKPQLDWILNNPAIRPIEWDQHGIISNETEWAQDDDKNLKGIEHYIREIKEADEVSFAHSRSNSLDFPHASLTTLPPNIRSSPVTFAKSITKIAGIRTLTPTQELSPAVTPGINTLSPIYK